MKNNLYSDILKILDDHGYEEDEIAWVGDCDDHCVVTPDEFKKMANIEYNIEDLNPFLLIVLKDRSYICIIEHDCGGIWNFEFVASAPILWSNYKKLKSLFNEKTT